jgi:hypothetical protein
MRDYILELQIQLMVLDLLWHVVRCLLSDADIDMMCLHFREVYVLWDGTFALARTFNPTNEVAETYQTFVSAAVQSSGILGCPITPTVHTMLRHVEWQMKNIPGGLGDKMEDWVERLHQWGMQQRRRFAQSRIPLFVQWPKRRQNLATPIRMSLLKSRQQMTGTRENYRRTMRLTYYRSNKKCSTKKGASKRWNILRNSRRKRN